MNTIQELLLNITTTPSSACRLSLSQWSIAVMALRNIDMLGRFAFLAKNAGCLEEYPAPIQRHLRSALIFSNRQQQQARFEASELSNLLRDIDITPIFLKGAAYSLLNNSAAQGRNYSDIDVLVKKAHIREAERKLVVNGWMPKELDDYDERYYREWAHEIPPMRHLLRSTVADIHHNLVPIISGRAPDITLFTRKTDTSKEGVSTLSAPARVLHSSVHLFYNEEFSHGFRDLWDLHLLYSEQISNNDFWPELLELTKKTNFQDAIYYTSRYCNRYLKTPFPQEFERHVNQWRTSNPSHRITDFIMSQVLLPQPSSSKSITSQIALAAGLIRGHWLKMPLSVLVKHLSHKLWKSTLKYTFGSAHFSKKNV